MTTINAFDLFEEIVQLPPAQRAVVLEDRCRDNPSLHDLLTRMLADCAASAADTVLLGRYEVHDLIGEGSFGAVYRGKDRMIGRDVAIKVVTRCDQEGRAVLDEAGSTAAVEHEHVLRVHDVALDPQHPSIILELVEGAVDLAAEAPRDLREGVQWMCDAAGGIAAAHGKGVFHRDLKLANILLRPRDRCVKVCDFGLAVARLHSQSTSGAASVTTIELADGPVHIAGTPVYMAPEQARGFARKLNPNDPNDRATLQRMDVYGLGACLYELLTGLCPYADQLAPDMTPLEVVELVRRRPPTSIADLPTRFAVPARLRRIAERAMHRDPARRFQSANDLAAALTNFLAHRTNKGDSVVEWSALLVRRRWPGMLIMSLTAVVAAITLQAVELEGVLKEKRAEISELSREGRELKVENGRQKTANGELKYANAKLKDANENVAAQLALLTEQERQLDVAILASQGELVDLMSLNDACVIDLRGTKHRAAKLQKGMDESVEQGETCETNLGKTQRFLQVCGEERNGFESDWVQATEDLDVCEEKLGQRDDALNRCEAERIQCKTSTEKAAASLKTCDARKGELGKDVEDARTANKKLEGEKDELIRQLREVQRKIVELEAAAKKDDEVKSPAEKDGNRPSVVVGEEKPGQKVQDAPLVGGGGAPLEVRSEPPVEVGQAEPGEGAPKKKIG